MDLDLDLMRGMWEVRAGESSGRARPDLTVTWTYSERDAANDLEVPRGERRRFSALAEAAHAYALLLTESGSVNWVRVEWVQRPL